RRKRRRRAGGEPRSTIRIGRSLWHGPPGAVAVTFLPSSVARRVFYHPRDQLVELDSDVTSDIRNQRSGRHPGLGVQFQQVECPQLLYRIVITQVGAGDASTPECAMSAQGDVERPFINLWRN